MKFTKDKHSSAMVCNFAGIKSTYREEGDGKFSAEFNDQVKFGLESPEEAEAYITSKYEYTFYALAEHFR